MLLDDLIYTSLLVNISAVGHTAPEKTSVARLIAGFTSFKGEIRIGWRGYPII